MKKTLFFLLVTSLYLVSSGSHNLLAHDNYYFFKKGNEERALGNLANAGSYYQEYIQTHPLTDETAQQRSSLRNRQFYLRNLLIAYDHLLDILREDRQIEQLEFWLEKLTATYQPEKFRSKNRYTLARVLYENNRPNESILLLEKIIDDQITDYWAGNNKVFLRAASKLLKIYSSQGNAVQLNRLYRNLKQCSLVDFDVNDTTKLASLFLKNEETKEKGEVILETLLNETSDDNSGKSVFLKPAIKLMVAQHQNDDLAGMKDTINKTKQLINNQTPPAILYKLGITYLKIGERQEGIKFLEDISNQYPNTIWARKSLFLLGRNALSDENWDGAIDYYATYIERYPQQTFFCLKAYSRLLDAHWSRDGNLEEQQIDISQFADIINETSDYETHLNMARELQYKGFDKLAEATFTLGYTYAQEKIIANPNSLKAMRINWQLTKYACEIGEMNLARESGESVTDLYGALKGQFLGAKTKKKADHYLSRTYLWLAKIYSAEGESESAKDVLQRFVAEYPRDSDTDYATFQLGKLYEDDLQAEKAAEQYKNVKKGKWKDKAGKALKRIGAQ